MRIFVPAKDGKNADVQNPVDLDNPDGGTILEWLRGKFSQTSDTFKIDFLVIHQGIIDKLDNKEIFKSKLLALLKEHRCTLVLCSGRGVPPQAYQQGYPEFWPRFVPVSALLERVVNNPSKFHLISLLEGSRVPHY